MMNNDSLDNLLWQGRCLLVGLSFFIFAATSFASPSLKVASDGEKAIEQTGVSESNAVDYLAIVGNEKISLQEFQTAVQAGIRKRFYHGKVPEAELLAYRKEVAQTLIDRSLLLQEARKRQIQPDAKETDAEVARYSARYAKRQFWQDHKDEMLPGLIAAIEEESLLKQLEQRVRDVPEPDMLAVNAFYQSKPAFFTTPKQLRVSLIMLKVDPASSSDIWQAASLEAEDLVSRLRKGADFGEMARIHSGDQTASSGGDMGYIHQGMLAAPAQQSLDTLNEGEISDPVLLLQGIAILKLHERVEPVLNSFEEVKDRAKQLLQRELAESAWRELLENLSNNITVSINESAM